MKVNNISGSNFYNMPKKAPVAAFRANGNSAFSNAPLQNTQDTVSFTGLMPFQKISPALQKGISELPVSKGLQKQLVKLAGRADTFFAKSKVLLAGITVKTPDMSPDEKSCLSVTSSLTDSARKLLGGKNISGEETTDFLHGIKNAYALLDKLQVERGLDETSVDRVACKKMADMIDEIIEISEGRTAVPENFETAMFKRITDVFKEIKTSDPEGVKAFTEEISAVKLPFWKK